jgi:hypothetical protein
MPERLVASRALAEQFWQEKSARMANAKNPHAVALGRRGGLKGGKARTANLTNTQRRELARKAAWARWGRRKARAAPGGAASPTDSSG